jgi:hypothetical protein
LDWRNFINQLMKSLKKNVIVLKEFSKILSNQLISKEKFNDIDIKGDEYDRELFLESKEFFKPPLISSSEFVPKKLIEHLMKRKESLKCGEKYTKFDQITNMEGAMHTFVIPICDTLITGDYHYNFKHDCISLYGKGIK